MMKHGYLRVGAATIATKVGNCSHNTNEIIQQLDRAHKAHISLLVFQELTLTGYTCGDLFMQQHLLNEVDKSLLRLQAYSKDISTTFVVGAPLRLNNGLYNCAIVIDQGHILGITAKQYLPNYNEYYEKRWFASGGQLIDATYHLEGQNIPIGINLLYKNHYNPEATFGIEICEDLWTPLPPSTLMAMAGATLILNPSASNDLVGKNQYRKSLVANQSARSMAGYVYVSAGYGESSTDVVFSGASFIYENGQLLKEGPRYQLGAQLIHCDMDIAKLAMERRHHVTYSDLNHLLDKEITRITWQKKLPDVAVLERTVDPHPFVPSDINKRDERCEEIFALQSQGLAKRLDHIGAKHVVIGISGGLDSTLALLVCVRTYQLLGLDPKGIHAITMPGFGTTDRTYQNACAMIEALGCSFHEISIKSACEQHFMDLDHDPSLHDITYENTQARERTQILMDYANKVGGLVIGTGDLSELALGWATYNGDHMSMYAVNTSIPKTLVRYLVDWVAHHNVDETTKGILTDVLDTPVSPELLPPDEAGNILQKTEEVVGPYELHDFYLYYMVRFGFEPSKIYELAQLAFKGVYDHKTLLKWLTTFYRRFFSQQFKRSCLPDGPKVGSINLSPRGDWRMPSDASATTWLSDVEALSDNNS